MNDIFGIPVEVLDSLPDGQVLLVNRKTWEQMKSAEPTTARPWTGASRMSEWRGLHNPQWHSVDATGLASCPTCGASCAPVRPCRCCLMAEWGQAQALRKQVQRVRDVLGDVGK